MYESRYQYERYHNSVFVTYNIQEIVTLCTFQVNNWQLPSKVECSTNAEWQIRNLKWLTTDEDTKVRLHKLLLRMPVFVETFLLLQLFLPLLSAPVFRYLRHGYRHRMACKECVTQMKLPKLPTITHSTIHSTNQHAYSKFIKPL